MESILSFPRRRQSSHMRENHALGPERPFLVKKHREGSREQAHVVSDDDEIQTSRGEKHRRKKKQGPSTFNMPSSSGPRPGISADTFLDRAQRPVKQKPGPSRSSADVPPNAVRPLPRGRREVSQEGKHPLAKAPNAVPISEDEAGSQPSYSGPIATMEFNRMKRELEAFKKVCCLSSWHVARLMKLSQQVTAQSKAIEKQANVRHAIRFHSTQPLIFVIGNLVSKDRITFNAPGNRHRR